MVGGFCFLEIVHVATGALGRQPLPVERTYRPHLVAGIAIHHRVRPNQREAILMLIDFVANGNLPPGIPMACIALRSIFASMNIGVAVLALVDRLREYEIAVTIHAADFRVHPAQRKSRLAMLKTQAPRESASSLSLCDSFRTGWSGIRADYGSSRLQRECFR